MKFLITAFEPFNGEVINPSREVLYSLPEQLSDAELIKCEIPTAFNDCVVVTREAIIKHSPDYLLNIEQAGGRFAITLERIAINIDDASIPDNNGNQPIDQVIQRV